MNCGESELDDVERGKNMKTNEYSPLTSFSDKDMGCNQRKTSPNPEPKCIRSLLFYLVYKEKGDMLIHACLD